MRKAKIGTSLFVLVDYTRGVWVVNLWDDEKYICSWCRINVVWNTLSQANCSFQEKEHKLEENEAEHVIAPHDTLLGQLQRGRGAGFLWALQETPEKVHPFLVECIIHDPRVDGQIETRSDYYARLAILTKLDLAPLEQHLRLNDDKDQFGRNTSLTVDVLGQLAVRSYANSTNILRDYVGYGFWWSSAIWELAEAPGDEAIIGLDEVVCSRFSSGQEMEDHPDHHEFWKPEKAQAVWDKWRQSNPRIAKLLDEVSASQPSTVREKMNDTKEDYETLSLPELLLSANARNHRKISKILAHRTGRKDKGTLMQALSGNNPFQWSVAFNRLQQLGVAESAYVPMLDNLKAFFSQPVERKGQILSATVKAMLVLPDKMTHDLARQWFHAPEWYLQVIGEDILEERATPEDIPMVMSALIEVQHRRTDYAREIYRISSLLDILARFSNIGPLPEVEREFNEAEYSQNRRRACEAMRANAPAYFSRQMAFECLWDCEGEIRGIACQSVDINQPGAQDRLHELANDPFEEEDGIRQAARARLQEAS